MLSLIELKIYTCLKWANPRKQQALPPPINKQREKAIVRNKETIDQLS